MKVLVVGGAGAFGSFYAKLLAKKGFDVSITDTNIESGKALCKENGFGWVKPKASLKKFDVVIVSVPNFVAPKVIRQLGPLLGKKTLLFDFCSIKAGAVKELKNLSTLDLELASVHPMHGPRIESIAGYPVLFIEIKPGKKLQEIKEFFSENGAKLVHTSEENHDRLLSVIQGLTHYSQFVSAAVLKELNIDLKDSIHFGTPNYHLFLSLMSRVILQNPELYAQIQLANPSNKKVWQAFKRQTNEFDRLCRENDLDGLKRKIIDSAQEFKGEDIFLRESDRAVNAINHLTETMLQHIGKKFLVQNILTENFHYGVIEGIAGNHLIINEGGKETKINVQNLRLPSKRKMLHWKKKNLKRMQRDYSFTVPIEANKNTIKKCLGCIKECWFELLDEYKSDSLPEGKKSLTVRARFFEEDNPEKIDEKIREMLKGLGFTLR